MEELRNMSYLPEFDILQILVDIYMCICLYSIPREKHDYKNTMKDARALVSRQLKRKQKASRSNNNTTCISYHAKKLPFPRIISSLIAKLCFQNHYECNIILQILRSRHEHHRPRSFQKDQVQLIKFIKNKPTLTNRFKALFF